MTDGRQMCSARWLRLLVLLVVSASALTGGTASAQAQGPPLPLPSNPATAVAATPSPSQVSEAREVFRDLSDDEALYVGQSHFPEALMVSPYDGRHPLPGWTVTDWLSRYSATAGQGHSSKPAMIQSTLPLRARDDDGEMHPVDLGLEASDGELAPRNDLVPVELDGDRPAGTLTASDARITVGGVSPQEATVTRGRTWFGDAFPDTDAVLSAQPEGFEVSFVIRSPAAPEHFPLKLQGVPEGRFESIPASEGVPGDPPRSVRIVDGDGEIVGYVRPPFAYDSAHRPIQTTISIVDDHTLDMTVTHRDDPNLLYPAYADPYVGQEYRDGHWTNWSSTQYLNGGATPFNVRFGSCDYYWGAPTSACPRTPTTTVALPLT